MRRVVTLIVGAATMLLAAGPAVAVPATMSFTARAADASGPLNGSVSMTFRMYTALSGGVLSWEESHSSITANDGLLYVSLGSVDPVGNGLDASVFAGGERYLEIEINGAVQSPRLQIGTVPYSTRSAVATTADTLGNLSPTDVALATHDHAGTYSPTGHNHDGVYASTTHVHPGPTCTRRESASVSASTWYNYATASCNAGEIVVSGGFMNGNWNTTNDQCHFLRSRPTDGGDGWEVTLGQPNGFPCSGHDFRAYALCCVF